MNTLAVLGSLAIGLGGVVASIYSVHMVSKGARESRVQQRLADAYLEVLAICGAPWRSH